jgi:glycosyl transferase family 25
VSTTAYVITIRPSDDDRLVSLCTALRELHLTVEVVEGVVGRDQPAAEYYVHAMASRARYGRVLTPGEVGCVLGHARAYERLMASGAPFAFVFEDDALLNDLPNVIQDVQELLDARSVDYLHLGNGEILSHADRVLGRRVLPGAPCFEVNTTSLPVLYGAYAYALSRAAAGALLASLREVLFLSDDFRAVAAVLPRHRIHCWPLVAHPLESRDSRIEHERQAQLVPHLEGGLLVQFRRVVPSVVAARHLQLRRALTACRPSLKRVFHEERHFAPVARADERVEADKHPEARSLPAVRSSMKTYVLTIRAASDPRLTGLCRTLQASGHEVEVVTGPVGGTFSAADYFALSMTCYKRHGYMPTPGELGCTLGHAQVYERVAAAADPYALVLEDDVQLAELAALLPAVQAVLRAGIVDYLHLGGLDGLTARLRIIGRPLAAESRCFELTETTLSFLHRTCGFILSREAAAALCTEIRAAPFRIDDFREIVQILPKHRVHCWPVVSHPVDLQESAIERERHLALSFRDRRRPRAVMAAALRRSFTARVERLQDVISLWRHERERVFRSLAGCSPTE